MELTSEERRQLISAYGIGCPVRPNIFSDKENYPSEIFSLYKECAGIHIHAHNEQEDMLKFDEFKMALKPLSQISDEDALEVAKLVTRYSEDIDYVAYRFEIQKRADTSMIITFRKACVINIDYKDDAIAFVTVSNIYMPSMFVPVLNMQEIVDYLRAKHYALPYHGRSLFELGVAIEKK